MTKTNRFLRACSDFAIVCGGRPESLERVFADHEGRIVKLHEAWEKGCEIKNFAFAMTPVPLLSGAIAGFMTYFGHNNTGIGAAVVSSVMAVTLLKVHMDGLSLKARARDIISREFARQAVETDFMPPQAPDHHLRTPVSSSGPPAPLRL